MEVIIGVVSLVIIGILSFLVNFFWVSDFFFMEEIVVLMLVSILVVLICCCLLVVFCEWLSIFLSLVSVFLIVE